MSKAIVFATENPGKLREINKFARHYSVEVLSPSQAGLKPVEVEETGTTYEGNAQLKVSAYLDQPLVKELIICGDDSGVEIEALSGEPGLHTRRWLGHRMSDDEIIGYTLGRLHGVASDKRDACFRSTLAYSIFGKAIQYVYGEMQGKIVENLLPDAPKQEGFPFRELFIVEGSPEIPLWKFDELEVEERQGILSHREQSFAELFEILK
jgi:XTP/dITP diphosphohydrolase